MFAARTTLRRSVLHYQCSPSSPIFHQRLLGTLAILEHSTKDDGNLDTRSLNVLTAASKLGEPITAFLAGTLSKSVAERQVASFGRIIHRILYVDNPGYDKRLPESYASLLVENIKKERFTHVVGSHGTLGRNILPRVAALLDVQMVSDVIEVLPPQNSDGGTIDGGTTFVRPIYAGNAIATVKCKEPVRIFTIRGTSFPAFSPKEDEAQSKEVRIEEAIDPKAPSLSEWVSENLTKSERPDLGSATKVVSGGRGLKDKGNFDQLMLPLADALDAAIGASRAAVDSGFADNSLQVGQTGKVVAPQLYLAVGISGAIQHLAGMKDSKVIAAINKDPDAPIFQVADVGLVGDLFQAVPELTEKLKAEK